MWLAAEGVIVEVVFKFLHLAFVQLIFLFAGFGKLIVNIRAGIGLDGGIQGNELFIGEFIKEVVDAGVGDVDVGGLTGEVGDR